MEYQSLNVLNEETRLLTVIPTPPSTEKSLHQLDHQDSAPTDLVRCRLDHFSLNDPARLQASRESTPTTQSAQLNWDGFHDSPGCQDVAQWSYTWGDYVALSYTWGDLTDKRDIILNGSRVAVGANLESALRVLSHKQPILLGYKIWVDALCINQQDIVERGEQVKRMGKIYRQAREVIVWLGNEGRDSGKAMDLIRTLSNSCDTGRDKILGDRLRQQPDLLGQGCWRALSELLDRPYWDRLWMLQEIALGVGRTAILCGHRAVTWREFYTAIYSFGINNIDVIFTLVNRERKDAGLAATGLKRNKLIHLDTEQSVQAGRAKPQFMCMLDLGRKSLATDPRDKIYGLLGMMATSVFDQIVLNYNATLGQVFTDFAKAFILANNDLELLEQCTCSTEAMPSWVPDWTDSDHFRLFSGRSTYHATKGSSAQVDFDTKGQNLLCQGFSIDGIDSLGERYFEDLRTGKPKDAVVRPSRNKNGYGSEGALKEALWSTLVGGRDLRGRKAPVTYQCLLECSPRQDDEPPGDISRGRTAFNRLITQSADLKIAGKALSSDFLPATVTDPEASRDPLERVFRFARTRRLMVTLDGFFGFAPHGARQGDIVFLLLGYDVPHVLRAVGEDRHYKVIGSCYLHGIMEGEGMEAGRARIEEVVLC